MQSQSAQADSSQTAGDPAGDANTRVAPNGQTTAVPNEPRADAVSASADYQAGAIVFSVQTAQPVNPTGDAAWGDSVVTWFIDTTGDKKFDFSVEYGVDGGNLYADVYNTGDNPICAGGGVPSVQGGNYVVTVNPQCFGKPTAFNWGGRMEFGPTAGPVMDRFPDGDGNYFGVVRAPGSPPGPTPTTRPGGGGGTPVPPPTPTTTAPKPIEAAPVASNEGFWLLAKDGGVFSFGTAKYFGSIGHLGGVKKVVSMAADPDGTGYWFVSDEGGIFAYKAPFWGSTGDVRLTKPIVGMAADPVRARATGWWRPTVGCSPSVTPGSTAPPGPSSSTSRSSE